MTQQWISVKDRPLIEKPDKTWVCTKDGEQEFLAAVSLKNGGWWIRHCVIEDEIGLCVVGEDDNEPAGFSIEDVEYWQPILPPGSDEEDSGPVSSGTPCDFDVNNPDKVKAL